MTPPDSSRPPAFEDKSFLLLVIVVSVAFAWILQPFYGAVLWGVIIAIVFRPLYRRLLRSVPERPTLAALATVFVILVLVILPISVVAGMLVQEGLSTYERIESGELNLGRYFQQVFSALPAWATSLLDRLGLTSMVRIEERLSAVLTRSIQFFAAQALSLGQNAANFI